MKMMMAGFYALEGESTCEHSCADALLENPAASLACLSPSLSSTADAVSISGGTVSPFLCYV